VPGRRDGDWGNFPRGAAIALQQGHTLRAGIDGVACGSLHGGGVSSSAAVGVAYLLAFEAANGLTVTPEENVLLDQAIENGYLGLKNGILDQAAILLSKRDHLTRIDCATTRHEAIPPAPTLPGFKILLAFSGLRKALVGTDYNRRVEECAEAARTLLTAVGRGDERPILGNVRPDEYAAHKALLKDTPAKRAEHFFTEVDRVERGIAAWKAGDLTAFGRLVSESGASSIRNYECGSPPLIDLYERLVAADGVYGARFSGAGFRGCCVALVRPELAEQVAERVHAAYVAKHPELADHATVVVCDSGDAAGLIETR
jgi:galacturonokinase